MDNINALVIDDSKVMRLMVIRALNRIPGFAWEYTEANDGAEALGLFKQKNYDIVFVDWNMPNMTGIEFVRQVRALGGTGHIPLVMVTSEKTIAKIEEALNEAGANAFICKPFTEEEVNQKVAPLLREVEAHKGRGGTLLNRIFG